MQPETGPHAFAIGNREGKEMLSFALARRTAHSSVQIRFPSLMSTRPPGVDPRVSSAAEKSASYGAVSRAPGRGAPILILLRASSSTIRTAGPVLIVGEER